MLRLIRLLLVAAIGLGLGLGSAYVALTDPRFDPTPVMGPWRIVSGDDFDDPYRAARAVRAGGLALGAAEGIGYLADRDDDGVPLDPACHYRVEGAIPAAPLWTFVVTDAAGHPPTNPAGRIGFSSRDVVRKADGTVAIGIGRSVRAGNFIPIGALSSLRITLRVYSAGIRGEGPGEGLPSIRNLGCLVGETGDAD